MIEFSPAVAKAAVINVIPLAEIFFSEMKSEMQSLIYLVTQITIRSLFLNG